MHACTMELPDGQTPGRKAQGAGFPESQDAELLLLDHPLARAFASILDVPNKVVLGNLACPCPEPILAQSLGCFP